MRGARWLWTGVAVIAGVAVGAGAMAAVERPAPAPAPVPPAAGGVVPVTAAALPAPVAALQGGEQTLLVWTPSRLPLGLGAGVSRVAGVDRVTTVRGGLVPMAGSSDGEGRPVDRPAPGWSIGLDAMAYDPATYPAFLPASVRPVFERLRPDQAILGASSAQLRRLGVGGTVEVGSTVPVGGGRPAVLTVAAVVDDRFVGATELTVSTAGADRLSPRMSDQYLLVGYRVDRVVLERSIRSMVPAGEVVRFRAPGETPFLRQGDAVLAQVFIKQRFGEFTYRLGPGKQIIEDPAWAADNIVVANVPILGRFRCHRALIPLLQGALAELQRRNLAFLVDKASFEGCWNPVLINPGGELSRHAWGAAVDLNYAKNPTGTASGQDPRLVAVMERWGFTWGGGWLVPDPSHFEYLRPPQA